MPINEKIAWIIRSSREQHGYSQEYMAEMLDIVQSTYAALESGKTSMNMDRLMRITEILELDMQTVISQCLGKVDKHADRFHHALLPETKDVYEKRIEELKEEIYFLRGMMRERESKM